MKVGEMVRGEPLSQAAPDSSPTEGSLWRNRSLCGDCQSLPYKGRWHGVSRDGEVGQGGSLPYTPGTSSLRASSRRAVPSGRSLAASIWPGETW